MKDNSELHEVDIEIMKLITDFVEKHSQALCLLFPSKRTLASVLLGAIKGRWRFVSSRGQSGQKPILLFTLGVGSWAPQQPLNFYRQLVAYLDKTAKIVIIHSASP